jgi:hypothetical protein
MITIVHGGQTGVDRGAHEGALANGWRIAGYMPRNGRDELGAIPKAVTQFLTLHDQPGFAARTEANVRTAATALIVVRDKDDPRVTPGTAKTLDLAVLHRLPLKIIDPNADPTKIARWIWDVLLAPGTLSLPLEGPTTNEPAPSRVLVAGPRESKWPGARFETVALLRRIARALTEIAPEGAQQ